LNDARDDPSLELQTIVSYALALIRRRKASRFHVGSIPTGTTKHGTRMGGMDTPNVPT